MIASLRILWALVFFYLFLRRQELGEGAAVAGAFAFGLGGFTLLWVGWPLANVAAWLPAVLWSLVCLDLEGRQRDSFALVLSLTGLLLSGHPETTLYAFALAAAFLGSRTLRRPYGYRGQLLRRGALACGLALALAAPVLLPAAELLPRSLRSARLEATETLVQGPAFSAGFARRLLQLAVPNAFGNDRFSGYWGLSNVNEDASGFAGTATLLALFAGLAAWSRTRRFPQERTAWAVSVLCLLLLAEPPGLSHLLQLLPFGAGLGSRRLLLPLLACIAFLGACGLERFRRGEGRVRPLLIAALALAGIAIWGTWAHGDPANPGHLDVLRFGFLRWHLRFLGVALVAHLAALRFRAARAAVPWVVALCIAAELTLAHRPANPPMPLESYLPQPTSLRVLRYQLGLRPLEGYRMAALGRVLPPNLASLYALSDVRVYNPMAPQAYLDLLQPIVTDWWGEQPLLGAPAHPLYRRLGVRYLLTRPGRRVPGGYLPLAREDDGWVWEDPGASPLLSVLEAPSTGETTPRREGRRRVPSPVSRSSGSLTPLRLEAQRISAQVRLSRPARLTTTLYQDGGWVALADEVPLRTGTDLGVLLAAELPTGRSVLELLYRPRSFVWGSLLAALGLAGAALALVRSPRPPRLG